MVTLRSRESKKGLVYYLDINNKGRQRITLKIPFNLPNRDRKRIAEQQRAKYELDINIQNGHVKKKCFITELFDEFATNYRKADIRRIKSSHNAFLRVTKDTLIDQVDIVDVKNYKDYLVSKYKPDTIRNYFKDVKKTFAYAVDRKYITDNPFKHVKNVRVPDNINKDILNRSEIELLRKTECGNQMVKRAFILACNTGLGVTDCKILRYDMIRDGMLIGVRGKGRFKPIPLNEVAIEMIGKGTGKVFVLPSYNGINKVLDTWVKRAKIDKHITFYSGRHTFGTLLAEMGIDHGTIKDLLGHSSYKYITRYLHRTDKAKIDAVNRL